MNYGELKDKIKSYLHRTDLDGDIPGFIESARTRINRRFGADLAAFVEDSETNDILDKSPNLYVYAALAEGYVYLHNGDAASTFDSMWASQADLEIITHTNSPLNKHTESPPQVCPGYPEE